MPAPTSRQKWVAWVLAAYLLCAIALLLSPVGPGEILAALVNWFQVELGLPAFRQGWIEVPANILLFVPLGFLMTLLFRVPWVGVVVAIAVSIAVEVVQILLPARLPSLRDVLANALGAAIGAAIAWLFIIRRRSARPPATTRAR